VTFDGKNEIFRGAFYPPHCWQHPSPIQVTFGAKNLSFRGAFYSLHRPFDSSLIL
jgi:hypothetical protein